MNRNKKMPKVVTEGMSGEERDFAKLFSFHELKLFQERTDDECKGTIAECTAIINAAEEELKSNPDYKRAKEMLAKLEKPFRDTKRYQECKRDLASFLLKSGKAKKSPTPRQGS